MFLLHYNFLTLRSLAEGHLLYNMVNKLHTFWHVAQQAKWLNPRAAWAYSFEIFIGKIGAAARSCVFSTLAHQVPANVVENYRVALSLRLARSRR